MDHEIRFLRRREGRLESVPQRVPEGTTLLEAARAAGLPIARACSGEAVCSRCALQIRAGHAALSAETERERAVKRRSRVPAHWRLACQARVQGAVTAAAAYW